MIPVDGLSHHAILAAVAMTLAAGAGTANAAEGKLPESCSDDGVHTIWSLRADLPVYKDATGSAEVAVDARHKGFGSAYEVNETPPGGDRFQVRPFGSSATLGWVAKNDVLCRSSPLLSAAATGGKAVIETKFLARTAALQRRDTPEMVQSLPSFVIAGKGSTKKDIKQAMCEETTCEKLGRFIPMFVHEIRPTPLKRPDGSMDRLLLVSDYWSLQRDRRPKGWVFESDGFMWQTAVGLRASEELAAKDEVLCAFPREQVAAAPPANYQRSALAEADEKDCPIAISGGKEWFRRSARMALLQKETLHGVEYYKVALPAPRAHVGSGRIFDIGTTSDGSHFMRIMSELQRVDVEFVIDGTSSMQPHINAIVGKDQPGIVAQIAQRLDGVGVSQSAGQSGKGTMPFRFGFQIYRDGYAGDRELGERHALPADCEQTGVDSARAFVNALSKVRATESDSDTRTDPNHENFYGGIAAAVDHLRSRCSGHLKIMVVIGDAGHSYAAQSELAAAGKREVTAPESRPISRFTSPDQLEALKLRIRAPQAQPQPGAERIMPPSRIITVFIQTPDEREQNRQPPLRNPEAYGDAWKAFASQAEEIVRHSIDGLPTAETKPILISDHLTQGKEELAKRVTETILNIANLELIEEIKKRRMHGEAIKDIIKSASGDPKYGNVPGVTFATLHEVACNANNVSVGSSCELPLIDDTVEAYIPVKSKIEKDVWMSKDIYAKWLLALSTAELKETEDTAAKRNNLLMQMTHMTGVFVANPPPPSENKDESWGKYIERLSGITVRDDSPLLQYNYKEIETLTSTYDCVISNLISWTKRTYEVMNLIRVGHPLFSTELQDRDCRSPDGKNPIPLIKGMIDIDRKFMNEGYTYRHGIPVAEGESRSSREELFWVPMKFMP